MRYVLQVVVMIFDALFVSAGLWMLCHPNLKNLAITTIGLFIWWKEGGFMAWKPSNIRQFLANAKKQGP